MIMITIIILYSYKSDTLTISPQRVYRLVYIKFTINYKIISLAYVSIFICSIKKTELSILVRQVLF